MIFIYRGNSSKPGKGDRGLPYCRECGAKLVYDRNAKLYVCPSCGLTYTAQELLVESQRAFEERLKSGEKKRKYSEYLEWWLSKK